MIKITVAKTTTPFRCQLDNSFLKGEIRMWEKDIDGDYVYKSEHLRNKAWIRLVRSKDTDIENIIYFGIVGNQMSPMTKSIYSIFHTRFLEMLLTHFDHLILSIEVSPLIDSSIDICS